MHGPVLAIREAFTEGINTGRSCGVVNNVRTAGTCNRGQTILGVWEACRGNVVHVSVS
jgi:hypothetical protein